MPMRVVRVIAFLVAILAMPVAAASTGAAFAPASDVELIDHGTMIVTGGWADRRETFEILRRADGGRTIVSTITAADGGYRVQGRWDYDAEERALSAHGLGQHDGEAVTIDILAAPPAGTLRFEGADGGVQTFHAPCKPRCLIDMTPSALPMFTMTSSRMSQGSGSRCTRTSGSTRPTDRSSSRSARKSLVSARGTRRSTRSS
mgnify:CR=1 FL=1